jgi:hypothetical protein
MKVGYLKPGTGGNQMKFQGVVHAILAPTQVAFDATTRATDPASTPFVTYAAAAETITLEGGCPYTAPTTFNARASQACLGNTVIILPKVAPVSPAEAAGSGSSLINQIATLEDRPVTFKLTSTTTYAAGFQPVITTLPTKGTLYQISFRSDVSTATPITTTGQVVTGFGRYLRYVSDPDGFGAPYDSFAVAFQLIGTTIQSSSTTLPVNIVEQDDLPRTTSYLARFAEDLMPNGYRVTLNMTDAESGQILDGYITRLPRKGSLYAVDTDSGNHTLITQEYNAFDVGTGLITQYADRTISVSSFWGGPPYAGYHALQVLGPPDCDQKGECAGSMPWTRDQSIYPEIGIRVVHKGLTAFVRSHNLANGTLSIDYHKMYKPDPDTAVTAGKQCHIDPDGATTGHPEDCHFSNVPVPGQAISAVVPRSEIKEVPAGVWCPLKINYQQGVVLGPNGGAFGDQYKWGPFNHDATFLPTAGIPYTEYIEIAIAEPVFIFRVSIGMPRGMGAVTHILVQNDAGVWIRMYEGAPRLSDFNEYNSQGRYWDWSPELCRPFFKADKLRIQLDTNAIPDWNYVDYVKVFGSRSISPSALRTANRAVIYVPNEHAEGTDSFEYQASDCPGDLFRSSGTSTIAFDIAPVNDLPRFTPSPTFNANVGAARNELDLSTMLSDVETPLRLLTVVITSLPALGTLYDGTAAVTSTPHTVADVARMLGYVVSAASFNSTTVLKYRAVATLSIGFQVTDTNGGVTSQDVSLLVSDPQIICPSGYIVSYDASGATCEACAAGTYETEQAKCMPCADGADCAKGSSMETLSVTASFWRIAQTAETFYPCLDATDTSQAWPSSCAGGASAGPLGTGYCRPDTFGPRCSICADPNSNQTVKASNMYFKVATLECVDCASESGRLGSSIAIIFTLLVIVGLTKVILGRMWSLPPQRIRAKVLAMRRAVSPFRQLSMIPKLKQLVSFFQLATCFPSVYNVAMPPEYTRQMNSITGWLDVSTLLNFIYPTQCIGSYITRLNFRVLGPLCLVFLPIIWTMTKGTVSHLLSKDKDKPWVAKSLFSGLIVSVPLTFALIPSVSRAIFTVWECEHFVIDPAKGEKIRFLRDDLSIICGTSDEHNEASALGTFYLFIWPIGMPIVYFFLCWANRKDNAKGMPTHFARATAFLWAEYHPHNYWWEPIEMSRKVVLAGLLMVTVPPSLEFLRLLVALLIAITFTVSLLVIRPFKSSDNNALAACTQIGTILMYIGALVLKIDADWSVNGAHWSVNGDGPTIKRLVGSETPYDFTIDLFLLYGVIFFLIVGFVIVQVITTARERIRRRHLEDIDQVKTAIISMTQTRFPAIFCRFDQFQALGKMMSHESLRAKNMLTIIDTYAELINFCKDNPTVFISHQWLSFFVPDPDCIQFESIVASVNQLAAQENLKPSGMYLWLDYFSIPQANTFLQAMAIDSLGVYASACRYFIVAAPPAEHREKKITCDHDTYAGRGWCRLEQWARMQDGLQDMYLMRSIGGELEPIADMAHWYNQMVKVFEGQFTVDTDKIKMVNICIGLWAKTAAEIRSGKELSPIAQLIFDKRDEVFPKEYFFKLTDVLNDVLANPDEQIDDLIKMMGQRSANAVTKVSADVIMKKMDTDGDGKVSEEEFNEYVALHGSSTIRSMVEQGRGLGISESERDMLCPPSPRGPSEKKASLLGQNMMNQDTNDEGLEGTRIKASSPRGAAAKYTAKVAPSPPGTPGNDAARS